MYAILEIEGNQFKVKPDSRLRIPFMEAEAGKRVKLDKVLLFSDGEKTEIGRPYIKGKVIEAEVLRHGREKKIVVFKKKRRKKYRKKVGHRQQFTEILITRFPSNAD